VKEKGENWVCNGEKWKKSSIFTTMQFKDKF
jgi:hypothetical protein